MDAGTDSSNQPMPGKADARNARSRYAQQQKAGSLPEKEKEPIDRQADKKLDE